MDDYLEKNFEKFYSKVEPRVEELEIKGYENLFSRKVYDEDRNLVDFFELMKGKGEYVIVASKENISISSDSILNIADNIINGKVKLTDTERKFFRYVGFNSLEKLLTRILFDEANPDLEKKLWSTALKEFGRKMKEPLKEESEFRHEGHDEAVKTIIEYLREKREFDKNILKK